MKATQTAKAGGMLATIVLLLTQLPEPYSDWVSYGFMALGVIGLIGTQIPAPEKTSRLWPFYQVLSFLAANWGAAVNYAVVIKKNAGKTTMSFVAAILLLGAAQAQCADINHTRAPPPVGNPLTRS